MKYECPQCYCKSNIPGPCEACSEKEMVDTTPMWLIFLVAAILVSVVAGVATLVTLVWALFQGGVPVFHQFLEVILA